MRVLFLFLIILCANTSADTFKAKIAAISHGDVTLIKFSNGRVGFIETPINKQTFKPLQDRSLAITLAEDHRVASLHPISTKGMYENIPQRGFDLKESVEPTILPDFNTVEEVFRRLNNGYLQDSECYNRAHVWTYEESILHDNFMLKAFIFFSDKYIKEHRFKWWFHVAPYALYHSNGALYGAVLDHQFTPGPISIKEWSDLWIETKKTCRTISRYSEYFKNEYDNECYLMKVDMYFWQPRDIEGQEKTGFQKNSFITEELQHAYTEAFGVNL